MASPCNTLNLKNIKISQLPRHNYLTSSDFIYVIESGSNGALYSRKSTLGDLLTFVEREGGFTGSFSGNFIGDLVGTSSWANNAVSSNTSLSSSYSTYSVSSTYSSIATTALNTNFASQATNSDTSSVSISSSISDTSSYLLQDTDNVGDSLAYWNGTNLVGSNILNQQYSFYYDISSSINQTVQNKQGLRIFAGDNADFWLVNTNRIGSGFQSNPNMDAVFLDVSNNGAFGIKTFTGSYHMGYDTPTVGGAGAGGPRSAIGGTGNFGVLPMLQQVRNNFYFWPQPGIYSTSRDGAVGIGVNYTGDLNPTGSFDQYLRAKFQIDMFSGSNEGTWADGGNPQVEHRSVAMLIRSVSGSITPTNLFYISSSGDTYVGGDLTYYGSLTSSQATSNTAGMDSTEYLPVMVGGTKYKVKLYEWS
jgi:hypothetical protein